MPTHPEPTGDAKTPAADDLVLTPAGPVKRKNVHPVGQDEAVRRNDDGSYAIVPRDGEQPG